MTLQIQGFPVCCGASCVTGFTGNPALLPNDTIYNWASRQNPPVLLGTRYKDPVTCRGGYAFYDQNNPDNKLPPHNGQGFLVNEKGEALKLDWRDRLKDSIRGHQKNGGHSYTAIITQRQISDNPEWLKILKELGFEFMYRFTNGGHSDEQFLYFFTLITDGKGKCKGDFTTPPKGWSELSGPDTGPLQKVRDVMASLKAA